MASTSPYFATITSESAFNNRAAAEGGKTFRELGPTSAASSWDRKRLIACRVVRRARQDTILPLLSEHAPTTKKTDLNIQIQGLLEGPSRLHWRLCEPQLVHIYGVSLGQIWAALGAFEPDVNEEVGTSDQPSAKRVRRRTQQEGFVDSSTLNIGSSSPLSSGEASPEILRSSHGSSSVGFVDAGDHGLNASTEDRTLRLVSCLIRHILFYFAPEESEKAMSIVDFRDEKLWMTVFTPELMKQLQAVDDGGLRLWYRRDSGGYGLADSHVAMVEAKRRFQLIDDGRPVITDAAFAQMTCEALTARMIRQDPDSR